MKRFSIVALLLTVLCITISARGKQPIALDQLPQAVHDSVLAHFTADQVQLATSQKTKPRYFVYELRMADGTRLEYNKKAQLLKVSNKAGIQKSYVPEVILTYVQATFPNAVITKYECETLKKEIKLNDDMSLIFDNKGKFIRIDD
jgi:hypothetical protein